MSRVLVTGGCGFIGSHVVNQLVLAGHKVIVLDLVASVDPLPKVSYYKGSVMDAGLLHTILLDEEPEYIFHIAAIADARKAMERPDFAVDLNIKSTVLLMEAATRLCHPVKFKRFIFASTCWVANAQGSGILDENEPFQHTGGGHLYTDTKIAAEMMIHSFSTLRGLPFTILRYGIPYGPGMWPGLALRSFLDKAASGTPLEIHGDGSATRRFVYVGDLARAHVLAMQDIAKNQVYNLEGNRFITIKELAEEVVRHYSGSSIVYINPPERAGEVVFFRKKLSSNKAFTELGWEPTVDLRDVVHKTKVWHDQLPVAVGG